MSRIIELNLPEEYNASEVLFHNLEVGRGDKVALYYRDQEVTYAQLAEQANRVGNLLRGLAIPPGERVMMLLFDSPAFPASFFGAVKAGYVPIISNTTLPSGDFEYFLNDSQAKAIIVDALLYPKIAEIRANCPALTHVIVVGRTNEPNTLSYCKLMAAASPNLATYPTKKHDMALWMYSSGSTGRPKGIVHVQSDIRYTIETYGKHILQFREDDIAYSVPKLFFAYGFGNGMTFPFAVGASVLLDPERPEPQKIFDNIERYRPTIFFGVPTLYIALINQPDARARDLSSIRYCVSAAEALPTELYKRWMDYYGVEICEGCGSTEMLHIYIGNTPGNTKPGSAGTDILGYDVKLVAPDDDTIEITTPYDSGVMMVRGASATPYYWNRPEKTRHTMRDGWIYTDDLFYRDEDGFYYFNGRANDIFKVSGQWVSPPEVEATLLAHPAVFESAVVPYRAQNNLIRSKAFIMLKEGYAPSEELAQELQTFVKSKIAPYKYPRFIEFVLDLPRTATGKIQRFKLRQI
ncbi:MAG: benzoate-CoA ligase family protein [Ardenticatenaceae bacterium]